MIAGRASQESARERGLTLTELTVVMAIVAILASVSTPLLGNGHAAVTVLRTAQRFAVAVRLAQAAAQDGASRTRVSLDGPASFLVESATVGGWVRDVRVSTGSARASSNFPGDVVEFSRDGWPLASGTGTPRAGTFTFSSGGTRRSVVLQLTGRVRIQ